MKDNPKHIAEYLIQKYGDHENAMVAAITGATKAQEAGDLYALSIWRDVKRTLKKDFSSQSKIASG